MNKHTHGPWHLYDAQSSGWPNHIVQGVMNGQAIGAALAKIPAHRPQSLANATLISLAPELLEALADAERALDRNHPAAVKAREVMARAVVPNL